MLSSSSSISNEAKPPDKLGFVAEGVEEDISADEKMKS
tara:strand:+ start:263 stop:376 length:114 start_codon:yes stop_codon:yes gene_type:complete